MNRKFSFERHKKNCVDRLKGAKTSNFEPYQCPSPKMAQKSAGAFIDTFLPRLSELYRRRASYQEVEDLDSNTQAGDGTRMWSSFLDSIKNNFLYSHGHRKNGFLPISSEVGGSEIGVVRVAVVGLGRVSVTSLDNWYSPPDEGSSGLSPLPHLHLPAQCPEEDQD